MTRCQACPRAPASCACDLPVPASAPAPPTDPPTAGQHSRPARSGPVAAHATRPAALSARVRTHHRVCAA
eukprot:7379574-Prymnesium_polylepis.1